MPFGTPGGWGSAPARGTPNVSRSTRSVGGQHRVEPGRRGSTLSKGGVRPLTDLPRVLRRMIDVTEQIPAGALQPMAIAVRDSIQTQGRPYALRGYKGQKVRLTAHIKMPMAYGGGMSKHTRFVDGTPPGFWRIVEDGSSKHLIAGRYRKSGARFTAKGASTAYGRAVKSGDMGAFGRMGSPINIKGVGWRQYAMHPGHGPIGHPWRRAMIQSVGAVDRAVDQYRSRELRKAFFQ